jgi:aspartate racemase
MGPAATIRLYHEITARTAIYSEQDHLRLVIDSDPAVPDRTEALLGVGQCPEAHLVSAARRLEAAGVDLIAIACNTAHAWYQAVVEAVEVPVLNLIEVVAEAVLCRLGTGASVGLLATDGTLGAGLYQRSLEQRRLAVLVPGVDGQREVMEAIKQVKTGRTKAAGSVFRREGQALAAEGAAGVVVGCTDISVVLADGDLSIPVVDSTVALAEQIILEARPDLPGQVGSS